MTSSTLPTALTGERPAGPSARRVAALSVLCPGLGQQVVGERGQARTFFLGAWGSLLGAAAVYLASLSLLRWLQPPAVLVVAVSALSLLAAFALLCSGLIFYFNAIEDAVRRTRALAASRPVRERPLWVTRIVEFAFTTDRYDM